MTQDLRPKPTEQVLREISARLYKVEQKASAPGTGGTGGGFTDPHPSVDTITIDGIVVGSDASPVTGLTLSTGSHLEDIWIDADWTAPADGTAESYDVEYARKVGSSYELEGNIRTGGTSVRINRLEPQTTYGVRVTAINRIGVRSDPEPAIGFDDITTGIDATVPAQVTGVTLTCGFKTATVKWAEVADRDVRNGTGIYEINLSTDSSFATGVISGFTTGTIITFGDLTTGTIYYARVRAIDNSGNSGAWSTNASDNTAQVGTVDLADTSVVTAKLANLAVDNSKLAALAVDAAKLADSAVESTKIANLAVGSAAIAALAVGTAKIADAAIIDAKIANLAVTTAKINDLAVTNAKIANLAVDNAKISDLDAAKITAGTIDANRIAANSIDVNKLTSSTLTSKTITIGSGGNLKIGNPPTTGIFINDQGIRLYSGSVVKVALDVAGTASFEGNISASTITSSTLTSATINSGTIQGVTITGATVRTASSGQRVAFESGIIDKMKFYTGSGNETAPGEMNVGVGANLLQMGMISPKATGGHAYCQFTLSSYDISTGDTQLSMNIRNGDDSLKGRLAFINQGSGETIYMLAGGGWFEYAFFDFVRTGTSAQAFIRGSGDYGFLKLFGGGASATLNCNIGLGSGFHVLDGSNSSFVPIQASAFNVSSSQATKKNIRNEASSLSRVLDMRVKRYNRIMGDPVSAPTGEDGKARGRVPAMPGHIKRAMDNEEIGLLAEDLLPVVPEAVNLDASGNPISINLGVLVALLVKSVQELHQLTIGK